MREMQHEICEIAKLLSEARAYICACTIVTKVVDPEMVGGRV